MTLCHRVRGALVPGCDGAANGNLCTCPSRKELAQTVTRQRAELQETVRIYQNIVNDLKDKLRAATPK